MSRADLTAVLRTHLEAQVKMMGDDAANPRTPMGLVLRSGAAVVDQTPFTRAELKALTDLFSGRACRVRECFYNAQVPLIGTEDDSPFEYWEGYGLRQDIGFPIHHAWIVYRGRVVDPTWRPIKPMTLRQRLQHMATSDDEAYMGVRFRPSAIVPLLVKTGATVSMLEEVLRGTVKAADAIALGGLGDLRSIGGTYWFEYHCNESEDSADAIAWHHSHQRATVIRFATSELVTAEGKLRTTFPLDELLTRAQRGDAGIQVLYRVRFSDGVEWDVFEDELLDSPAEFHRPDPPKTTGSTPRVDRLMAAPRPSLLDLESVRSGAARLPVTRHYVQPFRPTPVAPLNVDVPWQRRRAFGRALGMPPEGIRNLLIRLVGSPSNWIAAFAITRHTLEACSDIAAGAPSGLRGYYDETLRVMRAGPPYKPWPILPLEEELNSAETSLIIALHRIRVFFRLSEPYEGPDLRFIDELAAANEACIQALSADKEGTPRSYNYPRWVQWWYLNAQRVLAFQVPKRGLTGAAPVDAPAWLYHVTTARALARIQHEGLLPQDSLNFQHAISTCATPAGLLYWIADRATHFKDDPVVLRFRPVAAESFNDEWLARQPVAPKQLEIYVGTPGLLRFDEWEWPEGYDRGEVNDLWAQQHGIEVERGLHDPTNWKPLCPKTTGTTPRVEHLAQPDFAEIQEALARPACHIYGAPLTYPPKPQPWREVVQALGKAPSQIIARVLMWVVGETWRKFEDSRPLLSPQDQAEFRDAVTSWLTRLATVTEETPVASLRITSRGADAFDAAIGQIHAEVRGVPLALPNLFVVAQVRVLHAAMEVGFGIRKIAEDSWATLVERVAVLMRLPRMTPDEQIARLLVPEELYLRENGVFAYETQPDMLLQLPRIESEADERRLVRMFERMMPESTLDLAAAWIIQPVPIDLMIS